MQYFFTLDLLGLVRTFFFKENKYQIIKNLFHHNKYLKIFKLKNSIEMGII